MKGGPDVLSRFNTRQSVFWCCLQLEDSVGFWWNEPVDAALLPVALPIRPTSAHWAESIEPDWGRTKKLQLLSTKQSTNSTELFWPNQSINQSFFPFNRNQ